MHEVISLNENNLVNICLIHLPENAFTYDPDLFEGDMILTPEQREAALNGGDVDQAVGRGATKGRQWPGGVLAYVIDSSLCKSTLKLGD